MSEHSTPTKVVVVGGGYAGTLAANRLRADVDVTLVNPPPSSYAAGPLGAQPADTVLSRIAGAEPAVRKPGSLIWPKGGARPGRHATAAQGFTSP